MISQKMALGKIGAEEKLRVILIAAIALELIEKDRKILTQHLNEEDQILITKLAWLGIDHKKLALTKGKTRNVPFDLCRHIAPIETLAKEIMSNKYDKSRFESLYLPKTYDGSLGEKLRITATQIGQNANGQTGHKKNRAKLVFFLIGGISYAELRVLKEFETANSSLDVIAGGTAIISPLEFIESMRKMNSPSEYSELKAKDPL